MSRAGAVGPLVDCGRSSVGPWGAARCNRALIPTGRVKVLANRRGATASVAGRSAVEVLTTAGVGALAAVTCHVGPHLAH